MLRTNVIVALVVCVVLCLSAGMVVAGEKCKEVVIHHLDAGPILYGPENCNGYDGCATGKISGTFSGTLTESFYFADTYYLVDDAFAFTNHGLIETSQGELFFIERSIADFAAPDGFAFHANVTGGSGRYEGATGWIGCFDNFEATYSTCGGEVCWPED